MRQPEKIHFLEEGDDDFSFAIEDLARFRVNSYFQRGSQAAVIRVVSFRIPDYKELGIPEEVIALSKLQHLSLIHISVYELPYEGAKEMLFVDNVDDKEFLAGLFRAMYDELPAPKKKKIDSFKLAIDMFSDDFMEDGRSDELQ